MFILFDTDPERVLSYRQRLYDLRVHSLCLSPSETDRVADYPAHAILIPYPDELDDPIALCHALRKKYPHLPLLLIYREGGMHYYHLKNACDAIFEKRTAIKTVIAAAYNLYREHGNPDPTSLITSCVHTRADSTFVYVVGQPFIASHTQWMLIRYLNMAAPRAVPAEELLEVGFYPGRVRSLKNVSAQLTALDRVIERGCFFRVFHCRYPSSYYIRQSNLRPAVL